MSATVRVKREPSPRPFDTHEARHRHAATIAFRYDVCVPCVGVLNGYVYECPRCGDTTSPMRYRPGAERLADEHALVCTGSRATVAAG